MKAQMESTRNLYNEVQALADGTYLITEKGIEDYAARWAYGFMVAVREMDLKDLKPYTIFGVWTEPGEGGRKMYDIVQHVAAYQDAIKLARDMGQVAMFDLREGKVRPV